MLRFTLRSVWPWYYIPVFGAWASTADLFCGCSSHVMVSHQIGADGNNLLCLLSHLAFGDSRLGPPNTSSPRTPQATELEQRLLRPPKPVGHLVILDVLAGWARPPVCGFLQQSLWLAKDTGCRQPDYFQHHFRAGLNCYFIEYCSY